MVDLVGIEPTTFPASRDALKLAVSKHLSVLESNDAISSSLTVVPVIALRSKSRIAPGIPESKALDRELRSFVPADVLRVE